MPCWLEFSEIVPVYDPERCPAAARREHEATATITANSRAGGRYSCDACRGNNARKMGALGWIGGFFSGTL